MIIPHGNHVTSIGAKGDLTGVCHTVDAVFPLGVRDANSSVYLR